MQFLQLCRAADDEMGLSWQPVYGTAEKDERLADAAFRELLEETGLKPLRMFMVEHVETFFFRPTNAIHMLPVFAAEIDPKDPIVLNKEHTDYRWVDEDVVNAKFMWRSQRQAISILIDTLKYFPQQIPYLLV